MCEVEAINYGIPLYVYCFTGVSIRLEHSEYTIQETDREVFVCAMLNGTIEENVVVSLSTVEGSANGQCRGVATLTLCNLLFLFFQDSVIFDST